MRAYLNTGIFAGITAGINARQGVVSRYSLPTSATNNQTLDYSGLGLNATTVDEIINQLYSDGFCTNCIIDLSGNSAPTAASATALAGLREVSGMNNTVIVDSL